MLSDFLKKLMFARQLNMLDGDIKVLSERQVMLPLSAVKNMQIVDKDGLYLAIRSGVKEEVERIANNPTLVGLSRDLFLNQVAVNLFNLMGLGRLTIVELNRETYHAVVRVHDSDFALVYKNNKVCEAVTAGALAGIFSYELGQDVECREVQCMEEGIEYCQFEIYK